MLRTAPCISGGSNCVMPFMQRRIIKGLTGNVTCDQYGDCADPRIAVYITTADNVKKLEMPSIPFWKPY